jgi:hypothetical protein
MNDNELNDALGQWQVDVPDDSRFSSAVWREIAMRDEDSPMNRTRELLDRLLRPRFAIPVGATALLVTALLASFHGLQSREKAWDTLSQTYSQIIDPVAHAARMAKTSSLE